MKKWFTLIFFVKKFSNQSFGNTEDFLPDFLTDSDAELGFSPSAGSIKNILDFANSYEVLNSNSTGQIELITN